MGANWSGMSEESTAERVTCKAALDVLVSVLRHAIQSAPTPSTSTDYAELVTACADRIALPRTTYSCNGKALTAPELLIEIYNAASAQTPDHTTEDLTNMLQLVKKLSAQVVDNSPKVKLHDTLSALSDRLCNQYITKWQGEPTFIVRKQRDGGVEIFSFPNLLYGTKQRLIKKYSADKVVSVLPGNSSDPVDYGNTVLIALAKKPLPSQVEYGGVLYDVDYGGRTFTYPYVYVGPHVEAFRTDEEIVEFESPVENQDAFPLGLSDTNAYDFTGDSRIALIPREALVEDLFKLADYRSHVLSQQLD